MQVTTKITVDMTRQNVGQRVNAVQGDGNTRSAEITLLSGGQPWTPPEGVDVAIAYYQPDGHKGLYNLLADGSEAISMEGNVATIILAPQMLTVSGTVQASLVFNDAALNRLTTFPFSVCVASNPSAGAQKVEDYIRLQWLEDKLDEYLRKAADSGAFDGKPGENGVTFTPSVSENGDLSWRNNGGLPNPQTVNIRGPQGDSKEATAAANAAQASAANAETHAADAATSAAAAQAAVEAMGPEVNQIKDDLSDKLPKSPENWEAWTAEEQAAARAKAGMVTDTPFELVGDITTEEAVQSIVLMLSKPCRYISITLEIPPESVGVSRNVYFSATAEPSTIECFHRSQNAKTSETDRAIYKSTAEIVGGEIISYGGISAGTSMPVDYMNRPIYGVLTGYGGLKADSFTKTCVFTYGTAFPAGSSVKIYGC